MRVTALERMLRLRNARKSASGVHERTCGRLFTSGTLRAKTNARQGVHPEKLGIKT